MPVGSADILRHSPSFVKGHFHGQSSFLFPMPSSHRRLFHNEITIVESSLDDQSPLLVRNISEDLRSLMRAIEFSKCTLSSDEKHT